MSSKFFTNQQDNTLFDKFKGIAQGMANFHSFHAVVGFFRSSGYFKLREELKDVSKIQILVGINIDNIFRKHNRAMLMLGNEEEAKNIYNQDFINDVQTARYAPEVERGILQLCEDLHTGKVEMKIHTTKNLHAKFYLCLPENHTEHSDGWVIMGSSNISDSGLGITEPPRYELNVAMKDFDDVKYCKDEFDKLWAEAIAINLNDIEKNKAQTHIGINPTPFELYMKVLIDSFGDQIEDDFSITLPDGVRDLKYQKDAVSQGYQMLCEHNGFFLADVVGLGKTIVAAMIAQRFIEANGRFTNILVIYPPAVEASWKETFRQFGIDKKTQFVSNGSLVKILENRENYKDKEEFDLVIVDEAHNFRSDSTNRYSELQQICKSGRKNSGLVRGTDKKVILLSATPLNNRPEDLENLMLLFQDARRSTIDGINNLQAFFAPLKADYKVEMKNRKNSKNTDKIDEIYKEIRSKILDKITVRRTRNNILNDEYYKRDLDEQKIVFPTIAPPKSLEYQLNTDLSQIFYNTLDLLTNDKTGVHYARYRAVEFLKKEKLPKKFNRPKNIGENLKGIYRVHMVKRLESSFYAFKRSLDTFLRITEDMLKMFEESKIIVAPELKIKDLQAKGWELDKIIEYALAKGFDEKDFVFAPEDFDEKFIELLKSDCEKLQKLKNQWAKIEQDPKLELFTEKLQNEFFNKKINPTGKLVIFSESVDTVDYLTKELENKLQRTDILKVSSENRNRDKEIIRQCFDANYEIRNEKYNIIITSDVLAEGVNLHRANVIVNYDTPWNSTRLMQRIGRVNRIGSTAGEIHNYMFYPSQQGNEQIQLYENALIKLQGFHSALGEDAQIYSKEEIVREFQLFDPKIKDKTDEQLAFLREVRELYSNDRQLYKKIKNLPMKSRTARCNNGAPAVEENTAVTITFIQSPRKTEYYRVTAEKIEKIDFLAAARILKAPKEEKSADFSKIAEQHFEHVNRAVQKFSAEQIVQQDSESIAQKLADKTSLLADRFLRNYAGISQDDEARHKISVLRNIIQQGKYNHLPKELKKLTTHFKDKSEMQAGQYSIDIELDKLYKKYHSEEKSAGGIDNSEPTIVISETIY
jgi:superfamily II DNA/RNA helicase